MTVRKQADRIEALEMNLKRIDDQISFLKDMIQLQSKNIESLNTLLLGTIIKQKEVNEQIIEKTEEESEKLNEKLKDKPKTQESETKKTSKHLTLSRRVM